MTRLATQTTPGSNGDTVHAPEPAPPAVDQFTYLIVMLRELQVAVTELRGRRRPEPLGDMDEFNHMLKDAVAELARRNKAALRAAVDELSGQFADSLQAAVADITDLLQHEHQAAIAFNTTVIDFLKSMDGRPDGRHEPAAAQADEPADLGDPRAYYRVEDVAKLLKCHRTTVSGWIRQGHIRAYCRNHGRRRTFIPAAEFERLARHGLDGPGPDTTETIFDEPGADLS